MLEKLKKEDADKRRKEEEDEKQQKIKDTQREKVKTINQIIRVNVFIPSVKNLHEQ